MGDCLIVRRGGTRKAVSYKIWTVNIDQSNSNPLTCCTYADDAIGMTKGSSDWDDIFGYKPCIMKDGVVQGYLNPNDFTKYKDGSSAPITDATYDVMIEFPRMGLNISTSGDVITVKITEAPNSGSFQYYAHKRGSTQKDYFYLGAYLATGSSNKIGSNSGLEPLADTTLTDFITYAHNRDTGYEIMGFYQWTYIQALYILKYGNLNSQVALGQGFVDGEFALTTGECNAKGMCYGNASSKTDRVKLFGLEDCWGNLAQLISGFYCDSNYNLLTTTDNFSTDEDPNSWEFINSSGLDSDVTGLYLSKAQGTNNGGFSPIICDGDPDTYYSDMATLFASCFPLVGGGYDIGDYGGIFHFDVELQSSISGAGGGSRLMFL